MCADVYVVCVVYLCTLYKHRHKHACLYMYLSMCAREPVRVHRICVYACTHAFINIHTFKHVSMHICISLVLVCGILGI